MNLLNRYLQEVAQYLPRAGREDIVAELRANILSQMEDQEEHLGRPLTESEQVTILQHHGNPAIVAGRYRKDNRGLAFGVQLIGPELFPFYRIVLAINVSITLFIWAVVMPLVEHVIREPIATGRMLTPLVAQFFAVTLVFILLDLGKDRVLNRWNPRKLPPLKNDPDSGLNAINIF